MILQEEVRQLERDDRKMRSGLSVMLGLVGLVKPLMGFMCLAVLMGSAGNLCATFITVAGGSGLLGAMGSHENSYDPDGGFCSSTSRSALHRAVMQPLHSVPSAGKDTPRSLCKTAEAGSRKT